MSLGPIGSEDFLPKQPHLKEVELLKDDLSLLPIILVKKLL